MNLQSISGKQLINHATYTPDHYTQKFTVVIRSLSPISEQSIKDTLQKRYEVTKCEQEDCIGWVA